MKVIADMSKPTSRVLSGDELARFGAEIDALRARTVADLAGAETVGRVHIAEALSYRLMTG